MSSETSLLDGIIIGGAGGAIAGLAIWVLQILRNSFLQKRHKNRVYKWLQKNTKDESGKQFKSTREIASWNNLTEDRVRYICSIHKKIYLHIGKDKDIWSIYVRNVKGFVL